MLHFKSLTQSSVYPGTAPLNSKSDGISSPTEILSIPVRLGGPQIASEALRGPQGSSYGFMEPIRALGSLRRSKRRPSEGTDGPGRPKRTSMRPCRASEGKTYWQMDGRTYGNYSQEGKDIADHY